MATIQEEIWQILREVAETQKELARRSEEDHKRNEEYLRRSEEDRKRNEEYRRRSEEDNERWRKQVEEMRRQSEATERKIKEVSASIGKLGNRLGDFIEEAVRPAAVRLFQQRGIVVHEVHQNIRSQRGDEGLELDLLVVNDSEIVAIECKSNLGLDDVNEHLARLAKLKRLLPSYADKRVYGALAAMVIPDNVAQYAYRKGLYVIGQNGEDLEIRNGAEFEPGVW